MLAPESEAHMVPGTTALFRDESFLHTGRPGPAATVRLCLAVVSYSNVGPSSPRRLPRAVPAARILSPPSPAAVRHRGAESGSSAVEISTTSAKSIKMSSSSARAETSERVHCTRTPGDTLFTGCCVGPVPSSPPGLFRRAGKPGVAFLPIRTPRRGARTRRTPARRRPRSWSIPGHRA